VGDVSGNTAGSALRVGPRMVSERVVVDRDVGPCRNHAGYKADCPITPKSNLVDGSAHFVGQTASKAADVPGHCGEMYSVRGIESIT
jgi:hypothetical protein